MIIVLRFDERKHAPLMSMGSLAFPNAGENISPAGEHGQGAHGRKPGAVIT
jgi:hypothetical protein